MRTFLATIVILSALLTGCSPCVTGTGDLHEEIRILPAVTAIELNAGVDVILKQKTEGDMDRVVVSCQPNLMPFITTKVSNGKLQIDSESGCFNSDKPITISVYTNAISSIESNSSGNMSSEYTLSGDKLKINHTGSGNMVLFTEYNDINLELLGSGNVNLTGKATQLHIDLDGSGTCNAGELKSSDAEVNLNGSGDVSVFAFTEMNLALNGSGTIHYNGKPEKLNISDNGSGEIHETK